jgi:hypothetical protein
MLLARATAQKPTLMTASLVDFLASPKNRAKQQMTWSVGYQKRGHVSGWARRRGKTDPKDREAVWTVSNVRVESEVVMWSRLVEARHSRGTGTACFEPLTVGGRLAAAPHLNGRLAQLLGVGDEYAARIKLRLEV